MKPQQCQGCGKMVRDRYINGLYCYKCYRGIRKEKNGELAKIITFKATKDTSESYNDHSE